MATAAAATAPAAGAQLAAGLGWGRPTEHVALRYIEGSGSGAAGSSHGPGRGPPPLCAQLDNGRAAATVVPAVSFSVGLRRLAGPKGHHRGWRGHPSSMAAKSTGVALMKLGESRIVNPMRPQTPPPVAKDPAAEAAKTIRELAAKAYPLVPEAEDWARRGLPSRKLLPPSFSTHGVLWPDET
mmetsp:Transcript_59718/g.129361  ORF Transcript_59718/g.129361 Transcript_59718/m.129361 type:complete len:183 (-) Transcript_59718:231-779(-)